jgi:hypothetical protein
VKSLEPSGFFEALSRAASTSFDDGSHPVRGWRAFHAGQKAQPGMRARQVLVKTLSNNEFRQLLNSEIWSE